MDKEKQHDMQPDPSNLAQFTQHELSNASDGQKEDTQ